MMFSTQTLKAIQTLLTEEFSQRLESEAITAHEVEQALQSGLQEIGQASLGEMLSMLDEQSYETEELCECQQIGKRVSRREAQLLSLFGRVKYKRSYYQCRACGRRWIPLNDKYQLRPGRATHMMTGLLGLAGVTVSFEEARQQVMRYLQVEVSANTIRQETQWIGERQSEWQQQRSPKQKKNKCHPSYPGVCIPPPPPDLDCKHINYCRFKVLPPDPHGFDGDRDGIGCEVCP